MLCRMSFLPNESSLKNCAIVPSNLHDFRIETIVTDNNHEPVARGGGISMANFENSSGGDGHLNRFIQLGVELPSDQPNTLTLANIDKVFLQTAKTVDTNNDNDLSEQEIKQGLASGGASGVQKEFLEFLKANYGTVSGLDRHRKVSVSDMQDLQLKAKEGAGSWKTIAREAWKETPQRFVGGFIGGTVYAAIRERALNKTAFLVGALMAPAYAGITSACSTAEYLLVDKKNVQSILDSFNEKNNGY